MSQVVSIRTDYESLPEEVKTSADRIAASWRKSTAAIIETGQLLNEAEAELPEEQYEALRDYLVAEVGISNTVMSKLRAIARNPVLLDPHYHAKLPPSYATLYQISKIEDAKLKNALEVGEITPVTQLKDVTAKFGPLVRKPRKKPVGTRVIVAVTGDVSAIDPELLQRFKDLLAELKDQVEVSSRGL